MRCQVVAARMERERRPGHFAVRGAACECHAPKLDKRPNGHGSVSSGVCETGNPRGRLLVLVVESWLLNEYRSLIPDVYRAGTLELRLLMAFKGMSRDDLAGESATCDCQFLKLVKRQNRYRSLSPDVCGAGTLKMRLLIAFKGMSRDGFGIGIPQLAIASL